MPPLPDATGLDGGAKYTDKLKAALAGGANFASGFAFVEVGRGDALHHGAVVDVASGRATWAPDAVHGYDFQNASRLLVVNPAAAVDATIAASGCSRDQNADAHTTRYFEWKDGAFRQIAAHDPCEAQLAQDELAEFEARFPNFDATTGIRSSSYARILADAAAHWKMGDCRCAAEPVEAGNQWSCSVCCGQACNSAAAVATGLTILVAKTDGAVIWSGTPAAKTSDWFAGKTLTAHSVLSWQHHDLQNRAQAP